MTQERLSDLAEQLEEKASSVGSGFYGEDDDNESWAADLRRAAKRVRKGVFDELNSTDVVEIECGTDASADELHELEEAGEDA